MFYYNAAVITVIGVCLVVRLTHTNHLHKQWLREVFEEAGLRVRPLRCTALIRLDTVYPNGDHLQPTVAVFECEIVSGELKSLDGESLELRFFAPEHLPASPMLEPYPKELFARGYAGFYFEWKEEWLKNVGVGNEG